MKHQNSSPNAQTWVKPKKGVKKQVFGPSGKSAQNDQNFANFSQHQKVIEIVLDAQNNWYTRRWIAEDLYFSNLNRVGDKEVVSLAKTCLKKGQKQHFSGFGGASGSRVQNQVKKSNFRHLQKVKEIVLDSQNNR